MGGGKGSGNTSTQVTPEQTALLKAQTDALTGTFLPAYKNTIGGAGDVYNQQAASQANFANQGANQAAFSAQQGTEGGLGMIQQGAADDLARLKATESTGATNLARIEALETALAQIEVIRGEFRNAVANLGKLGELLKAAQREQKASEKEVQGVRQTLRSLQSVRI